MKKITIVLFWACCLFPLAGCGHDAGHLAEQAIEADHSGPDTGMSLKLNDGKKWQVDAHTRSSAADMTDLLRNTAPVGSVEDARALAVALDEKLKGLIQGCTMTGPAHDELHVFLVALFPRVEKLKNGSDPAELHTVQQEIVALFDGYEQHFQ